MVRTRRASNGERLLTQNGIDSLQWQRAMCIVSHERGCACAVVRRKVSTRARRRHCGPACSLDDGGQRVLGVALHLLYPWPDSPQKEQWCARGHSPRWHSCHWNFDTTPPTRRRARPGAQGLTALLRHWKLLFFCSMFPPGAWWPKAVCQAVSVHATNLTRMYSWASDLCWASIWFIAATHFALDAILLAVVVHDQSEGSHSRAKGW